MEKEFVFIASFIKDSVLLSWFLSNYSGLCEKCGFEVYDKITSAIKSGKTRLFFKFSKDYEFMVESSEDRFEVYRVY